MATISLPPRFFLSPEAESLACQHCKNVVRDPLNLPCGHLNCKECYINQNHTCGDCKARTYVGGSSSSSSMVIHMINLKISKMQVRCQNAKCNDIVKFGSCGQDLEAHYLLCGYKTSKCGHCMLDIDTTLFAAHTLSCEHRPVICACCLQTYPYNKLKVHADKIKFPLGCENMIQCPNQCITTVNEPVGCNDSEDHQKSKKRKKEEGEEEEEKKESHQAAVAPATATATATTTIDDALPPAADSESEKKEDNNTSAVDDVDENEPILKKQKLEQSADNNASSTAVVASAALSLILSTDCSSEHVQTVGVEKITLLNKNKLQTHLQTCPRRKEMCHLCKTDYLACEETKHWDENVKQHVLLLHKQMKEASVPTPGIHTVDRAVWSMAYGVLSKFSIEWGNQAVESKQHIIQFNINYHTFEMKLTKTVHTPNIKVSVTLLKKSVYLNSDWTGEKLTMRMGFYVPEENTFDCEKAGFIRATSRPLHFETEGQEIHVPDFDIQSDDLIRSSFYQVSTDQIAVAGWCTRV